MIKYNPQKIEEKWQKKWQEDKLYQAKDFDEREKYYCLDMFPYPSGEGLHVGHWRGYVLSDMITRYQMLNGKNVLHPMGWDAFGLPAENAAIKNQSHPKIFTQKAITRFKEQLFQIGASFDWEREINTSDPSYYKWTQWLFLQLYKNKLAYRKNAPVNWCPNCQTVLANEQVVSGECERCGAKVTKKNLTQWFFKITDFADDLLNGLDDLDWPERTKTLQRNWIGKSEGAMVKFQIKNLKLQIEVFTTRPDTLFGATFMVLAPENDLIEKLKDQTTNYNEVEDYIKNSKLKSEIERTENIKEKTGVELKGIKAINPINHQEIPIWVADYVLSSYGTGACMCVPAHDERDFDFAKKFDLPIIQVISKDGKESDLETAFIDEGILINSDDYNGLNNKVAAEKITQRLSENNIGKKAVNYRLRDWLISRQRYWGAPIPIIYCDKCGEIPVPEKDLPVLLPEDVEFHPHGDSPLKQSKSFLNTTCPQCGGKAVRETDTMDTFVDSSWYYIAYAQIQNSKFKIQNDGNLFINNKKEINYWLPVDFYIGGVEHAILHLLYARFISLALHKLKLINFSPTGEPFKKLFNIGMIYLNGAKMSKSKGNIVSPDELRAKYGTDALRGYELFIGPADLDCAWQVDGISGIYRFLEKVWDIYQNINIDDKSKDPKIENTIKIVTNEITSLRPNTAISHLMEIFNYLKKDGKLTKSYSEKLLICLAPFFPHLAEEIWANMGNKKSIFLAKWPKYDEAQIKQIEIKLVVQINSKVKDIITVDQNDTQEMIENKAKESEKVNLALKNKNLKKVIYVAGKVLNFVVE